jgi:hypothetical protein
LQEEKVKDIDTRFLSKHEQLQRKFGRISYKNEKLPAYSSNNSENNTETPNS